LTSCACRVVSDHDGSGAMQITHCTQAESLFTDLCEEAYQSRENAWSGDPRPRKFAGPLARLAAARTAYEAHLVHVIRAAVPEDVAFRSDEESR
jgi:hypothetical protein